MHQGSRVSGRVGFRVSLDGKAKALICCASSVARGMLATLCRHDGGGAPLAGSFPETRIWMSV